MSRYPAYDCFYAALIYELKKPDSGGQARLVEGTKKSSGGISQIIKGPQKGGKRASIETGEAIAGIYGYLYEDFIAMGRRILEKGTPELSTLELRSTELKIQLVDRFQTFHEQFAFDNYIPVKLVSGAVAAGTPTEIQENDIEGWALIYAAKEWMPGNPEDYTCCHVVGDSMAPILNTDDLVAIDHSQRIAEDLNGKMVAFRANGGVTIKWLTIKEKEQIIMGLPENRDFAHEAVILKTEEEQEHGIVGRIAWWWAKR